HLRISEAQGWNYNGQYFRLRRSVARSRAPRSRQSTSPLDINSRAGQRLVVAQINQAGHVPNFDQYSGIVDYTSAPWFDWGPYLWASRGDPRNFDGLLWCNGQNEQLCNFGQQKDVRYG